MRYEILRKEAGGARVQDAWGPAQRTREQGLRASKGAFPRETMLTQVLPRLLRGGVSQLMGVLYTREIRMNLHYGPSARKSFLHLYFHTI